jgi:hypothetical protein
MFNDGGIALNERRHGGPLGCLALKLHSLALALTVRSHHTGSVGNGRHFGQTRVLMPLVHRELRTHAFCVVSFQHIHTLISGRRLLLNWR